MLSDTRTAIVTGGIQGLGTAAAHALADAQVTVAVTYLDGGETFEAFGGDIGMPVFELDVRDFDACALARECAGKGVTVNTVAPGYVDTAMLNALPDDIPERILKTVPLSRLAGPEEIGRRIRCLASDDAGFITGATLAASGGLRMG